FGIDFATRAELIANGLTVEEIGKSLGADSLSYISIDGMTEATTIPKSQLCRACFDGEYPMALPDPELLGKYLREPEGKKPGSPQPEQATVPDVDGVETLTAGIGGADALRRP
ncbi:MAG TPA: amidophosphoribosyltransferase, partial [Streptomyces sp.]|nr:amidophosphoribosyltransferase [Streptomyces sp.]